MSLFSRNPRSKKIFIEESLDIKNFVLFFIHRKNEKRLQNLSTELASTIQIHRRSREKGTLCQNEIWEQTRQGSGTGVTQIGLYDSSRRLGVSVNPTKSPKSRVWTDPVFSGPS